MRVLNVCVNDWANYSYTFAKALSSVGVEANSVKINPHEFWYEEQSSIRTFREICEEMQRYDIINFVHSDIKLFSETKQFLKGKKVVVTYTGSLYRRDPEVHNNIFNERADIFLTDQCEFFGLGAKNLHYAPVAIDTDKYPKFMHSVQKPYVVGHYPSNKEVKGTEEILKMLAEVKGNYSLHCSTDRVKHHEQMKRMSGCDIYVELFKNELNGKPYGCYGVTAFEAAAMGKVVITQNIRKDVYLKAFGPCPFIIVNSKEDFIQYVTGMVNSEPGIISALQTETYNWICNKHSMQATGHYLEKLLSR